MVHHGRPLNPKCFHNAEHISSVMPTIKPDSVNDCIDSARELSIGHKRGHGAKSVNVCVDSHFHGRLGYGCDG